MNEGIIYIARNPEYKEDIYKIGKTERTYLPLNRMIELSNHEGVIGQFKAVGYVLVNDIHEAEQICHQELKDFRYQNNREFFKIDSNTLTEKIKNALSNKIIKDNLPKSHKEKKDEITEGEDRFIGQILHHMQLVLISSPKRKKIINTVDKELKNISNQIKEIGGFKPWDFQTETKQNVYCFELRADHRDFVGIDLFHVYEIFEKNDIKKNYPEPDRVVIDPIGITDEIRKIELIDEQDSEYLKKSKQTQNKLKEIYKNDQLYAKYQDEKSKEVRSFYNLDNYIWYGFLTKAPKKMKMIGMTDGKKTWEEEGFEIINPKTIFWKGSLERVLLELRSIIQNNVDYIEIHAGFKTSDE